MTTVIEIPEDVRKRAAAEGWREDLVQRMVNIRMPLPQIEQQFTHWTPQDSEGWLDQRERLLLGSLRGRPAMWSDGYQLSELWRNAPEQIGDWEVVVEREPFPFAQYMLHENVGIRVVEDRGYLLGCGILSWFNAYVAGRPMALRVLSGWRVRTDARGIGVTRLFNHVADAPSSRHFEGQFFYVRWGNLAAEQWMEAYSPGFLDIAKVAEDRPPGQVVAEVLQYPARAFDGDATGIRKGRPDDVRACARLVNRTHKGLDLFRPYTEEFLRTKLDEWSWSQKPDWWTHVYGRDDFWVVEDAGTVVACAGLWDRGEHVREVWRHKQRDESRTIATTCLLDFGFARGREDAIARLVEYLLGRTADLGRDFLLAPLQYLPRVASRLEHLGPVPERRGVTWLVQKREGGWMVPPQPQLGRVHVDLGYW